MTYEKALKNIGKMIKTVPLLKDQASEEWAGFEGILENVDDYYDGIYTAHIRICKVSDLYKENDSNWESKIGKIEDWRMYHVWGMELAEIREFDDDEND